MTHKTGPVTDTASVRKRTYFMDYPCLQYKRHKAYSDTMQIGSDQCICIYYCAYLWRLSHGNDQSSNIIGTEIYFECGSGCSSCQRTQQSGNDTKSTARNPGETGLPGLLLRVGHPLRFPKTVCCGQEYEY